MSGNKSDASYNVFRTQTTVADDDNESGQLLLIAVDQTPQILHVLSSKTTIPSTGIRDPVLSRINL